MASCHDECSLPCSPWLCVATWESFLRAYVVLLLQVAVGFLPLFLPLHDTTYARLAQQRLLMTCQHFLADHFADFGFPRLLKFYPLKPKKCLPIHPPIKHFSANHDISHDDPLKSHKLSTGVHQPAPYKTIFF